MVQLSVHIVRHGGMVAPIVEMMVIDVRDVTKPIFSKAVEMSHVLNVNIGWLTA